MDVSIIIVNYNTCRLLCECIHSIYKYTEGIEFEVIVVDNASIDNSRIEVENKFPQVRWIQSDENLGFGKANNLGSKVANGKYLFYLNSDTILLNNALKYFFDYSENHCGFGALGCILVDRNHKPIHSYGKFPTQMRLLKDVTAKYLRFLKDRSCLQPEPIESPLKVEYITGADLWVPKDVFDQTGGFDKDYFMYYEELDWQYRMSQIGLERIIIPGPEIIHLEGGSESASKTGWSENRKRNFYKSQKIYQQKHFNKKTYPLFRIAFDILNFPSEFISNIINR